TVTLAKYPLLLTIPLFWAFGDNIMEITDRVLLAIQDNPYNIADALTVSDYAVLTIFSLLSFVVLVWTIALLFNAFKVSTNMKGIKCGLMFTAIILVAEILINVVISTIY
ncbi:MAG: hypothetical protein FWF09_07770, partial [Bacteroidales bacterium]|nr:hypothetical protein [Bacteroidales bacterium]